MEAALHSILLRRCRALVAEPGPGDPSKKAVFLVEAFALGFLIDNPEAYSDDLLRRYDQVMPALARLRGGHVTHVPLYGEFPNRVPEQGAYLTKRLLGYIINSARWDVPGKVTEGGYVIPEWLFNLEHFGANPITQMQDLQLFLKAKFSQLKRLNESPKVPTRLRIVGSVEAERLLQQWLRQVLSSKTSYPVDYRQDFMTLLNTYGDLGLTPEEVGYREHRALLSAFLWTNQRWERLASFCQTPSDLLRVFAALTATDVSLDKPVKYPRLSRRQRRFVLECLERMSPPDLVEDQLHKYRGLWLKLEAGLHSGTFRSLFPRAVSLFDKLRAGATRPRFSGLEQALARGDSQAIVEELERFPAGVSVRRFAHAAAAVPAGQRETLLSALWPKVERASLKDLLVLRNVMERDGWARRSLVLTKRGATQVIPRHPERLEVEARQALLAGLETRLLAAVQGRFGRDWEGRKVFVAPELASWVVPLSLRSANDSLVTLGRGTRMPLARQSTVRLYVYWRQRFQRTDLDLSAVTFDEEGRCTGWVDWTRLRGHGLVHSGDLQSAAFGAAEFIDAEIETMRQGSGRYLAPSVFRYSGDAFGQMECFTGWMTRDKPDADYKTFDPVTIQQKVDLGGQASYAVPFVIDLQEREVLWLDLSVYTLVQGNQVANAFRRLEQLVGAGRELGRWAPTLLQLAHWHVRGRGALQVDDPEGADLRFGTGPESDYHPGNWSRVLSELL